jgi:signal transduction histidine kinase
MFVHILWSASGCWSTTAAFWWQQWRWGATQQNVDRHIAAQVFCDILALSCLLYFSDLPRNPFLFYYVLPMIIAGMYLRGWAPVGFGILVTVVVGAIIVLEYQELLPRFPMRYSVEPPEPLRGAYLWTLFLALSSSLWITLYFAVSIRMYVDRAHEQIRQKEKMVGIGQLVASIGHEIANPLDGVQNCLRRIGSHVKDDPHLVDYIKMMEEALDRIEKTTKRVQSFARPRGIQLQPTSVNAAVEAVLELIGLQRGDEIAVETDLADVPLVEGDPYTLQEILFNLCMNAIAAMPDGGRLTLRTCSRAAGRTGRARGHRRDRYRLGDSARAIGANLRTVLHHARRERRHRLGIGPVPHADRRDGRPHSSPIDVERRHHVHRRPATTSTTSR